MKQPRSTPTSTIRVSTWTDANLADAVRQIAEGSDHWDDKDKVRLLLESAMRLEEFGKRMEER